MVLELRPVLHVQVALVVLQHAQLVQKITVPCAELTVALAQSVNPAMELVAPRHVHVSNII